MGGWKKVDLHRGELEAALQTHQPPTLIVQVSPLYLACYYGETEFALMLLRAGASPDLPARRNDGRLSTPLYLAATHPDLRNEEVIQAILEAGATIGLGGSPLERRDEMKPEVLKMITGAFNHQCDLIILLIYICQLSFHDLFRQFINNSFQA